MNKTIGVLAHVDAGKTTFCEQILYHTKAIRNRGRVDNKDTFLDNHNIEKQRGITIFSEQGMFNYNNSSYYLIDTPGHIDFSPDMERSISIMDYAVIIVSGVDKIQSHTKTVFRLLNKYKVPTIFFVNKMDRESAELNLVIKDIQNSLTKDVIDITNIDVNSILNEELIEFIAERDDNLFEKYLNDEYDYNIWIENFKNMIKELKIYPLLSGSAINDIGIDNFLEKLDFLTYTNYKLEERFIGKVYKIKHDDNKNKLTYIKALQGKIKVKDEVSYIVSEEMIKEKVNNIRKYNSNKFEVVNEATCGELFVVSGLNHTVAGDFVMEPSFEKEEIEKIYSRKIKYEMTPTLKSKVKFDSSLNIKEVLNAFEILNKEEPALNVLWDEKLKEIHIHVMGKIQLEILKEVIKERFNLDVDFGKCEILYKESILKSTIGYGHFEPLGHYAEVHLLVEPSTRNSGITFNSKAHIDDLAIGHQNLVRTHIFEKEHRGILGGYPLIDLNIILLTGRAHKKHTSGGDFRQATLRALRQGLEKVENVLLEPYYKFKIETNLDYMGRVISDIQKMNGEFETPIINENLVTIEGRGPVATFMDYSLELSAFSKGSSSISFIFDGYDVCHNPDYVLENRSYDKNSDSEYTSNSIFCSKGQGYVVKGSEAKLHMHCIK